MLGEHYRGVLFSKFLLWTEHGISFLAGELTVYCVFQVTADGDPKVCFPQILVVAPRSCDICMVTISGPGVHDLTCINAEGI